MALPTFVSIRRQRRPTNKSSPSSSVDASPPNDGHLSQPKIKAATRTRLIFSLLTSALFFIALIFLILVEIGNTRGNKPVLGSIYFMKLDLSHIIPLSVPNASLINSIARTLGLHDFYQVGLWNYCVGYGNEITECSKPVTMYWFDPVSIILSELLAGATIALPQNVIDALSLVRLASRIMFALFLTGACTCFVSIFLTPLSVFTRWTMFPIAIFTFLTALTTTAATIIATVMFIIFQKVMHSAEDTVNIIPEIGMKMFAFMWTASACAIAGWLFQMGMCCCCASRRDVTHGKKTGRRMAWKESGEVSPAEMGEHEKRRRGLFGRKKQ